MANEQYLKYLKEKREKEEIEKQKKEERLCFWCGIICIIGIYFLGGVLIAHLIIYFIPELIEHALLLSFVCGIGLYLVLLLCVAIRAQFETEEEAIRKMDEDIRKMEERQKKLERQRYYADFTKKAKNCKRYVNSGGL